MLQVLIVGVLYLLLYKYLLSIIGIELLGVWSLIIATTSVALIANFGISSSIVKFVATYHARGELHTLKKLVFTASLFIVGTYLIISVSLWLLSPYFMPHFIEKKYLATALSILPYSLFCLVINALGGVISSSLDGIQKNYLKSYIVSSTSVLLFVLSVALTPAYGLKGLVFAQIIQGICALFLSGYFLSLNVHGIFSLKWNWSTNLFKEIINYGLKMQALSIMQMTFEPVTKGLLSKFGGLAMVGYYEMASRLVSQFRSIIVSANQVIIPVIAAANENNKNEIKTIYVKTFSLIFFFNCITTSVIIVFAPLISLLWIGKKVPFFLFAIVVNSIVVFVNIMSNPAYFSYLGEGRLNKLIYSYLIIVVLNGGLGYILGSNFNQYGVVLAWNVSFLLSSLFILLIYQKQNAVAWHEIVILNNFYLFVASLFFGIFGYLFCLDIVDKTFNIIHLTLFIISSLVYLNFIYKNEYSALLRTEFLKIIKIQK